MPFSFSPASTTVVEGNTTLTFIINRSGTFPAQTVYASTLFDTATSGNADYFGFADQAVVFASGQTSATLSVVIRDDALVETTEHSSVHPRSRQITSYKNTTS